MLDQGIIEQQKALLAQHRRRLAVLLQQYARLGDYVPPHVPLEIEDVQAAIRNLKAELRSAKVAIEDEPNDDARPVAFDIPSRLSSHEQRNRSRMLDKVETFWIKGVLEQSLYQIARLELGVETAPAQISHPWQSVLHQANQPNQIIPAGKSVIALFDDLLGEMLILGAPGAGKTTMLLELARGLIARARQNEQHHIPVVFNLSTWATKRQPLGNWLADELNLRYDVPKKLAQEFVNKNAVVPLLDGLDEVALEHRDACVEAINEFRSAYGFVPLAISSRITDYEALTSKLRLQGAIVIQPLTKSQVDEYLKRIGRPLSAVRAALRDDATLWELMENPLMLSIAALAYKDMSAAKLRSSGTAKERRKQLFDDYIAAMFARPGRSAGATVYKQQETVHWLSWLAEQMVRHNQTVFYIEQMQPDWLPPEQQRGYRLRVRFLVGLCFGVGFGLVVALISVLNFGLRVGLIIGLAGGLLFGLYGALRFKLGSELKHIKITEGLVWSWSRTVLRFGLLSGLVFGLAFGLNRGLRFGLSSGLISGVIGGLALGLLGGLVRGLVSTELAVRATPNQGIRRSARSWLVVGLGFGLFSGLLSLLLGVLRFGLRSRLIDGLLFGLFGGLLNLLVGGLIIGLTFGGQAVFQHYTLRWLLSRSNGLPYRDKDLIPFLDYCTERIFLRKVGGGYIFVHRLLMEHFASMYTEPPMVKPTDAE